jgi:light-regulated signal transduction histidine kinase (bacteriophytochrome)
LETIVAERTHELSEELAKRERTEHELKALIRELDDSREAAFNLTEDLIAENIDRRLAEENVLKLNNDLEKRVMERTAQLDDANKELESFSYSISHDLQAPLRHINGFAEMLAVDYQEQLPEEARHFLDTIMRNAKMMSSLIDDLLDFSRNSRKELEKANLDMEKVVEAARLQIVEMTDRRDICWNVSEMPTVSADYNLILMVWMNLISNAVKYSSARDRAIIDIGSFEIDSAVIYYIRDNGIGFDMKYARNLFGAFQRLDSSKGYEGTGIGLANVRKIILRHGGKVWAKSEADKGASFYFSLPKANSPN